MLIRTFLILSALVPVARAQAPVSAKVETAPVPTSGDAADDPAIWVHPTNPSLSVIIATDKNSGLAVYDLTGKQLQFLSDGEPDNVDLRTDFPLAGKKETIVVASDRSDDTISVYVLDPNTRLLRDVAARNISTTIVIYGCCMYRSMSGEYYVFCTSKSGGVEQWRLFDNGSGKVDATRVRTFDVGTDCEGCAADDELGYVYIAEETTALWRYGAEPGAGTTRVAVDTTSGHLTADIEGIAVYYAAGGKGYLIASSQGDNTFVAYDRRPPHSFLFNFEVVSAGSIDGVTDCDGCEVMNLGLGSAFPNGVFVVQDGTNTGGNQNFKLIDWKDISVAANPDLLVDNTYNPHAPLTCSSTAAATSRAGTNPTLLTSLTRPVLGTTWQARLNCTGFQSNGMGFLVGFERSATVNHPFAGQILVDAASRRLFYRAQPHLGGNTTFNVALPNTIGLCGSTTFTQGLCMGGTRAQLTNAIDIFLGN